MDSGNNGGRCYKRIKGMRDNLLSSKASGRFKLIGLTAATCELVLCICILDAKTLSVTYVKGFDYLASIPYESGNTT